MGHDLTFPTDHPDVPKVIQTIQKLHGLLFDQQDNESSSDEREDFRQPPPVNLVLPQVTAPPKNSVQVATADPGLSMMEGNKSMESISHLVSSQSQEKRLQRNLSHGTLNVDLSKGL